MEGYLQEIVPRLDPDTKNFNDTKLLYKICCYAGTMRGRQQCI